MLILWSVLADSDYMVSVLIRTDSDSDLYGVIYIHHHYIDYPESTVDSGTKIS